MDLTESLYDDAHGHKVSVRLNGNVENIGISKFIRYVFVWINTRPCKK